ncbi:phosphatase PAP2-related protein [Luteolibacter sp. SL250]|uniref:phosphatase PAP2-related protein n=1 Tax=Luteolibacter sp. SL250 TaxID=2995170 RepID=UPI00226E13DC|nr:phosphatase PAP2-related protein [Luteolibacter sp. SL250]WAC18961.1 phosphatase PAP2-related protein [Luteolibacter sp. SL250]
MSEVLVRTAVVVAALGLWFWSQRLIAAKADGGKRIVDGVHRLTAWMHRYFYRNRRSADRVLVVSSLFIDVMGLSLIAMSLFGESFRAFIGLLIVFGLRQASQFCCTLPPPRGMIWRHPGFPSALVTYGVSNDLFFSGHTALAVLAAIEICQVAPPWVGVAAVLVAAGEAATVLILRAHYTMDVVAGGLAAWFAADLAGRLAPVVDGWLR